MRAARFLLMVLLVVAIVAGGVYFLRLPLAGLALRAALSSSGFEKPTARVTELTLDRIAIRDLSARGGGGEAFRLDTVEAAYRWRRLLAERKVDTLRIGPGSARFALSDEGVVSLPGAPRGGADVGGKSGALPFDRVTLSDISFVVDAADGAARGSVSANYDIATGGDATLTLASDRLVYKGVTLEALSGEGDVILSADGSLVLDAKVSAAAAAEGASAKTVSVAVKGEGGSWREVAAGSLDALSADMRLDFSAPDIALREGKAQAVMSAERMETIFGEKIANAAISGALDLSYADGGFEARIAGDAPLILATPDGGRLSLSRQGDAPLYARDGGAERASLRFALKSAGVDAAGTADFERAGAGWRFVAPLDIHAYASPALTLAQTSLLIDAVSEREEAIDAEVTLTADVRKAAVGRLAVADAPVKAAFAVAADTRARRAIITNRSGCLTLERARGRIAEQGLDGALAGATLCDNGGPLAVANWADEPSLSLAGVLTAERGSLRIGDANASGRPPALTFEATYRPAENRTVIAGDVRDGAMVLNNLFDLADTEGRFDFTLDQETMRATARLDRIRVAQHRAKDALLLFAPLMAAGEGTLENEKARFSYVVTTPDGYRLGTGAGVHDLGAGRGETTVSLDDVLFLPVGLQPNRIFPALKGVVDAAQGEVSGAMRFGWSRKGVTSGANFDFDGLSFNGPTRAVTHTSGVSGSVALSDLLPVTTDGLQTITVDVVNMDALKLADGVISFAFPGDDTLRLAKGEFPWFGGVIGVYDATASMTGKADIPLKAQHVDLKQVLEYIDAKGLSGEGVLSGELPLVIEDGRARIVNGVLKSEGPGVIRYAGAAGDRAAEENEAAKVAFDLLRNLRYDSLEVVINGALDGALDFGMKFEGYGDVAIAAGAASDVPVLYRIKFHLENINLLRKADLGKYIRSEVQRAVEAKTQKE